MTGRSREGSARSPRVRLSQPFLGPEVETLVLEVVRSGQLAQGPMVARLEQLGAAMAGCEHAVAVANGTVALEAAFEALQLGPGDEVITSPFTFAGTLNAALRAGLTVRCVDITDDYTVDPESVGAALGPRTVALLPVHLYGYPANMRALTALADQYGLAVVEDAAQAHGATFAGQPVGSFGIGAFSFYATKNVAAGEGGLVTTSDGALARRLRLLRNQGTVEPYRYELVGHNLRMTDLAAAVALPQLERLSHLNAARSANAAHLDALLGGTNVTLPPRDAERVSAWHQYTVLLPTDVDRERIRSEMLSAGVETGVYYPRLVTDHAAFAEHPAVQRLETPRAADVSRRCLSLPVHPQLTAEEIEFVAITLREVMERT